MSRARVLIFTGPGKGKTTAALGMALRATGHGLRALVIQFVKSDASVGEIRAAANVPLLEMEQVGSGFLPAPESPEFAVHVAAAQRGLARAAEALASGKYALIVLDEICYAAHRGLLAEEAVCSLIESAPGSCVLALTGRNASERLREMADTVTEMQCAKHGLQSGIKAQRGVEF